MYKNSAFTLIELLVVVLIIGILASIAAPQFSKIILKAKIKAQLPAINSIWADYRRYYSLYGDFPQDTAFVNFDIAKYNAENIGKFRITHTYCGFGAQGNGMCSADLNYYNYSKCKNGYLAMQIYACETPSLNYDKVYARVICYGSSTMTAADSDFIYREVLENVTAGYTQAPNCL